MMSAWSRSDGASSHVAGSLKDFTAFPKLHPSVRAKQYNRSTGVQRHASSRRSQTNPIATMSCPSGLDKPRPRATAYPRSAGRPNTHDTRAARCTPSNLAVPVRPVDQRRVRARLPPDPVVLPPCQLRSNPLWDQTRPHRNWTPNPSWSIQPNPRSGRLNPSKVSLLPVGAHVKSEPVGFPLHSAVCKPWFV